MAGLFVGTNLSGTEFSLVRSLVILGGNQIQIEEFLNWRSSIHTCQPTAVHGSDTSPKSHNGRIQIELARRSLSVHLQV